jgi:hypothetical protein
MRYEVIPDTISPNEWHIWRAAGVYREKVATFFGVDSEALAFYYAHWMNGQFPEIAQTHPTGCETCQQISEAKNRIIHKKA